MNSTNHNMLPTLAASILGIVIAFTAGDAIAAASSSDWVQPAVTIIESLRSGVVTVGALLVGLCIMFVGVWACISLNMDWKKLGYVGFGGVLIMAGPQAIAALLEAVK